jgi:hypothetical protein
MRLHPARGAHKQKAEHAERTRVRHVRPKRPMIGAKTNITAPCTNIVCPICSAL